MIQFFRPRVPHTLLALVVAFGADASHAAAMDVAGAFSQLSQGVSETRIVSLKELGLLTSVTLTAPDTRREFFLPVPADVPISDATLQFDGAYVRGDGGRTTMLLSLDGSPVSVAIVHAGERRRVAQYRRGRRASLGRLCAARPRLRVGDQRQRLHRPDRDRQRAAGRSEHTSVVSLRSRRRARPAHRVERVAVCAGAGHRRRRGSPPHRSTPRGAPTRCCSATASARVTQALPTVGRIGRPSGTRQCRRRLHGIPAFDALRARRPAQAGERGGAGRA